MPDRDVRREGWKRFLPRSARQVGRRGAILMVFGFLWIVVGAGVFGSEGLGEGLLHEIVPSEIRGTLWVVTGLIAIGHAFRPPGMSDAVGFAALYITPAIRVLSYGLAWVGSWFPGMGQGYPQAWRFLAVYAAMLAAVVITSGWPEPTQAPRPERDDDGDD